MRRAAAGPLFVVLLLVVVGVAGLLLLAAEDPGPAPSVEPPAPAAKPRPRAGDLPADPAAPPRPAGEARPDLVVHSDDTRYPLAGARVWVFRPPAGDLRRPTREPDATTGADGAVVLPPYDGPVVLEIRAKGHAARRLRFASWPPPAAEGPAGPAGTARSISLRRDAGTIRVDVRFGGRKEDVPQDGVLVVLSPRGVPPVPPLPDGRTEAELRSAGHDVVRIPAADLAARTGTAEFHELFDDAPVVRVLGAGHLFECEHDSGQGRLVLRARRATFARVLPVGPSGVPVRAAEIVDPASDVLVWEDGLWRAPRERRPDPAVDWVRELDRWSPDVGAVRLVALPTDRAPRDVKSRDLVDLACEAPWMERTVTKVRFAGDAHLARESHAVDGYEQALVAVHGAAGEDPSPPAGVQVVTMRDRGARGTIRFRFTDAKDAPLPGLAVSVPLVRTGMDAPVFRVAGITDAAGQLTASLPVGTWTPYRLPGHLPTWEVSDLSVRAGQFDTARCILTACLARLDVRDPDDRPAALHTRLVFEHAPVGSPSRSERLDGRTDGVAERALPVPGVARTRLQTAAAFHAGRRRFSVGDASRLVWDVRTTDADTPIQTIATVVWRLRD